MKGCRLKMSQGRETHTAANKQRTGMWNEGRRVCVFEWDVVV